MNLPTADRVPPADLPGRSPRPRASRARPARSLRRRPGWAVMTLLAAATALLSSRYFTLDQETFLDGQQAVYAAHLAPLLLHIGAGVLALLLGPWQFLPGLRARHPGAHRWTGRAYLVSAAVTGVGGLLLAPRALVPPVAPVGFAVLGGLTLGASAAAYRAARQRRFDRHRGWAIRSYALILTAVTLRIWLPVFDAAGADFDTAYAAAAWAPWLINLLVAEYLIGRPVASPPGIPPAVPAGTPTSPEGPPPDVSAPAGPPGRP
ncbi:DUF2306 domain-containing protein [Kitasatospora sp. NPDC090091]|uniref:DUF2306 domain-containing protein n=1 Tax=Kitasatospora sp. NPDC090091 TaxID=3364081 RepID=UPI0037F16E24